MFKTLFAKIAGHWPQSSVKTDYEKTWYFFEVSHPAPGRTLETLRKSATTAAEAEEDRLAMQRAYGVNRIVANRGFKRIPVDQPITE